MGPSKSGPQKGGGPKFRFFFFPLPPQFSFFFFSLGVLAWNLMCTFGVLGLSYETENENCGGRGKRAKFRAVRRRVVQRRVVHRRGEGGGGPAEGSIGNGVQNSWFRVQFRFLVTETAQKQNE